MIREALLLTFFGLMITKIMGFISISWWLVVLPLFVPIIVLLVTGLLGASVNTLLGGKK